MFTQMSLLTSGVLPMQTFITEGQDYGPDDLEPRFDGPWMSLLNDVGGWVVGTVIVVGVILLVIAAIIIAGSKSTGMSRGQEAGVTALLWIGGLMAVVGSAGGLIAWLTDLDLGF